MNVSRGSSQRSRTAVSEPAGMIDMDLNVPEGNEGVQVSSTERKTLSGRNWYEILKLMRTSAGLTQESLVYRVSGEGGRAFGQSLYCKWEMGQRKKPPEWRVLASIAEVCGYSFPNPLFLRLRQMAYGSRPRREELFEEFQTVTEKILGSRKISQAGKVRLLKQLGGVVRERPAVAETILETALTQAPRNLTDWLQSVLDAYKVAERELGR
jgi:transcriptional regulator with XRE-family HTH domain